MSLRIAKASGNKVLGLSSMRRPTVKKNPCKVQEVVTRLKFDALSKERLAELMPAPSEIQPNVFSTAATVIAQKAMVSPAVPEQKTDTIVTSDAPKKNAKTANHGQIKARDALKRQQGPSASPVTSTTAVAQKTIKKQKRAAPDASKQGVKQPLEKRVSDTSTVSSESRLSTMTQSKTLFMIGSLIAGLGALIAKVGPAVAGQFIVSNATLAGQLIASNAPLASQFVASNVIAFLTPGVATVSFAGKIGINATIVTTQIAWPVLLPILSTIVVGTVAVIAVTYIASKILESIKSRIRAAFQAMVDSLNSSMIGSLVVKGATAGAAAFVGSDKSEGDRSISMETDKPTPARAIMVSTKSPELVSDTETEPVSDARNAYNDRRDRCEIRD